MDQGALGKEFQDGEIIVRQGDVGDSMFVIQEGRVEVLREDDGHETRLRVAEEGEFMGEMSIFERQKRSATLRALGKVRILTIDKKNFLRRIHEDPSLAFRIAQNMSSRIRELSDEIARLKHELGT
jgi:CRP/FNR family cyclic AMP-dependent transcriptional regulator